MKIAPDSHMHWIQTAKAAQKAPDTEKPLTMSDIVILASRARDLELEGHTPATALLIAASEEMEGAANDQ